MFMFMTIPRSLDLVPAMAVYFQFSWLGIFMEHRKHSQLQPTVPTSIEQEQTRASYHRCIQQTKQKPQDTYSCTTSAHTMLMMECTVFKV